MATIKDVAEKAGVSVATVSAVINTDSNVNVSNKLKVRVEEAIRELNYRPNRIAQALSTNKTRILAYVVPTIKNTFFSQMAHFIEDEAFEKGYGVYLCITQSKAERVKLYLDNLIENRVAGVIVTLTWEILDNNFIETVLKENIPIVGIAGARMFNNIDTVITDDVEGTEIAIKHLIARGHERIGFIGTINSKTTEQRIAGYLNAIKESHFNYDDKYIVLGDNFNREDGYILADKLLKIKPMISAVFVYNDVMAAGVIDKFNDLNIRIPEDISVVGYDDSVANFIRPKLTIMAVPKKEMVTLGMDMLFRRINKEETQFKHENVLPRLIIREST